MKSLVIDARRVPNTQAKHSTLIVIISNKMLSSLRIFLLVAIFRLIPVFAEDVNSIKGKLDLRPYQLDGRAAGRTFLNLYQIANFSDEKQANINPFTLSTTVDNNEGLFEFTNLPILRGVNESTYFVISADSKDFNLKPNRILVEFKHVVYENGTDEIASKAFMNYYGREYIAQPDIHNPDKLTQISMNPYINIKPLPEIPTRHYFQIRNTGLLESGPVASILKSRWKLAGIITAIAIGVMPMIIQKLDPSASEAMKEQNFQKKRELYTVPANAAE